MINTTGKVVWHYDLHASMEMDNIPVVFLSEEFICFSDYDERANPRKITMKYIGNDEYEYREGKEHHRGQLIFSDGTYTLEGTYKDGTLHGIFQLCWKG